MARRIEIRADESGGPDVMTFEEVPESDRLNAMMGSDSPVVAQSAAAAMLAEIRARRGSLIETVKIDGVSWHLLRMDFATVNEVAARTMREGGGLRLDDADVYRSFVAAVLQSGVVKGLRDRAPFFNPTAYEMDDADGNPMNTTEIEQFMLEPEAQTMIAELFDRLTDLNTSLWPQKKSVMEAGRKYLESQS